MPRLPRVSYETIFDVLKDLPIFEENGEVKKKKDPVWKEACRILPDINMHNLYFIIYQDRKNIKTNLMKHQNIVYEKPKMKKMKKREPTDKYSDIWDNYDYYDTLDMDDDESLITNDIDTLTMMKNSKEYRNIIHKIGMLPFNLSYWHPDQVALWNELINVNSTVTLIVLDNVISELTGSIEVGKIYFYALVTKARSKFILLGQMLTDSIASCEVESFLNTWIQKGACVPQEIVLDYSYNLLDAASLSFNFCSFNDYNLRCYKYLTDETSALPSTLIYIDVTALINVVDGWACFENILQPVKDLYLCSVMYLSTVENLEEFNDAVLSLLTLCQSPFQSALTETRKASLWVHLTTDNIQQMNQQYIDYVTGKFGIRTFSFSGYKSNTYLTDTSNELYNFINQLKQQALEMCDCNLDEDKESNDYYCPIVLEDLMQLLMEFPSWTKIVVKNSNSALVSLCTTKHLSATLQDLKEPMSPPEFFLYHLEKIKTLTAKGNDYITGLKNRGEFRVKEFKNIHTHLMETGGDNVDEVTNGRIESSQPAEEEDSTTEFDMNGFKNSIQSTINSLITFDDCIQNVAKKKMRPTQVTSICKLLLDCCTEMKAYEKFLAIIVGRFCLSNEAYANSFKHIFRDCYSTIEVLDRNELRNTSKLYAHLLMTDSISWDILYDVRLNEKTSTPKKNFIRILVRELCEHMGIARIRERFEAKSYRLTLRGLFPTDNQKDAFFAAAFYKSIGLKGLGDMLRETVRKKQKEGKAQCAAETEKEEAVPTLRRSSSNSSISSSSSCDFVIEVKVSKKRGDGIDGKRKKVVVVK